MSIVYTEDKCIKRNLGPVEVEKSWISYRKKYFREKRVKSFAEEGN